MIPFLDKKYKCIVADPPWEYESKWAGAHGGSAASRKYETMSLEKICALPVPDITDKDCVLFLWATTPLLEQSFEVLKAWKFKYRTALYWHKVDAMGIGWWFRGQVEVCHVATHGKIRAFQDQSPNIIIERPRLHSQKPKKFFYLVDTITRKYNLEPKLEMFARDRNEGWDAWGNQVSPDEQKKLRIDD